MGIGLEVIPVVSRKDTEEMSSNATATEVEAPTVGPVSTTQIDEKARKARVQALTEKIRLARQAQDAEAKAAKTATQEAPNGNVTERSKPENDSQDNQSESGAASENATATESKTAAEHGSEAGDWLKQISPEAQERIKLYNITDAEVAGAGSVEQLNTMLNALDYAIGRQIKSQMQQAPPNQSTGTGQPSPQVGQIPTQQNATVSPAPPQPAATEFAKVDFDDDLTDPALKALGQNVQKLQPYADKVTQLEQQVRTLTAHLQHQELTRQLAEFDDALNAAGDGVQELIGSGPTLALDRNGAEFKKRVEVLQLAEALRAHFSNGQPAPLRQFVSQSLRVQLGAELEARAAQQAVAKKEAQLRNRQGQFTSPPGGRVQQHTETLTDAEKRVDITTRKIAEYRKANGQDGW